MIWIVTPYAHFGGGFGGLRGLFPSPRDLAIHNKFGFYPNAVDTSERAIMAREVSNVIEAKVQQGVQARSSAYG